MDKETVIETIIEIVSNAKFSFEAAKELNEELSAYGYSESEISLILTAVKTDGSSDKKTFAGKMYSMLSDKDLTRSLINDTESFLITCIFMKPL